MVDHLSGGMYSKLIGAWSHIASTLPKLHPNADMRPSDISSVLRVDSVDAEAVKFELKPVAFRVPDREYRASGELYVVARGLISFDKERYRDNQSLATRGFSTEVAYFRRDGEVLAHVLGVHYDFAPGDAKKDLAHPVFHGQLKSFSHFAETLSAGYNLNMVPVDHLEHILGTARVPTAQMDIFSVLLQVFADHLVHSGSGAEERSAFDALVAKASFCIGAAWRIDRLCSDHACQCYRSRHWYPVGL